MKLEKNILGVGTISSSKGEFELSSDPDIIPNNTITLQNTTFLTFLKQNNRSLSIYSDALDKMLCLKRERG